MKIVFMGTPEFAAYPLEKLHKAGYEVSLVVSQPDKPKDRGKKFQPSPVKLKALELGLPVETPEKIKTNEEFIESLRNLAPDFIIVAAYGKILPKAILDIPKFGCINIHASLLPKYRGAAPIHRAVLNGEKETGVSIMYMAEGMDTGDVIAVRKTDVAEKTTKDLFEELSIIGTELLLEQLPLIASGKASRTAQNEEEATYAPMIFKENGHIDYEKSAFEICCLVRALYDSPSAFTMLGDEKMKIHKASVGNSNVNAAPGTVVNADKNGIEVACKGGSVIFTNIQMPGKKAMDVSAFLLGNHIDKACVLR